MIQLVIAIFLFVGGIATGIKVHSWQIDARDYKAEITRQHDMFKKAEKVDMSAAKHEANKVRIEKEYVTVIQEIEHVVDRPFYRDGTCFDDDGVRLVNQAIGIAPAASQPAPALPGPRPAP